MSSSLSELFERVPTGLLWVQVDGNVRHANGEARRVSALRTGDALRDPALFLAVQLVARMRVPRLSALSNAGRLLRCRVIPGLAKDDAFVLLDTGSTVDETAGGADRLLRAVDQGLRGPLHQAETALQIWREDPDPHAATVLAEQVGDLLVGLNRLLDLAGLWTSDGVGDDAGDLAGRALRSVERAGQRSRQGRAGTRHIRCRAGQVVWVGDLAEVLSRGRSVLLAKQLGVQA